MRTFDWKEIADRIIKIRGEKARDVFAEEVNAHINTISNYELNKRKPDADFMFKLLEIGVNINWLLSGEGAMYSNDSSRHSLISINEKQKSEYNVTPEEKEASGFSEIGRAANRYDSTHDYYCLVPIADYKYKLFFEDDLLAARGLENHFLYLIDVQTDAMEPTIKEGAMVVIDKEMAQGITDGIYAIGIDSTILFKRLQRNLNGSATIKSDNPSYDSQQLSKEEIDGLNIIGKVVWVGNEL